ncbi:GDSL esterase/lipase At5g41890 isoform X1 [Hordeum vulgare subsp. vulgare]|uniref:GDSL esterase/lipase At5g41890 isoform X1 n=1 Tax=Hordeum vulgare subsp. vulgare TaxID=112509 RepID=UPI001D1A45CD|nr:GDSL esterase/lipase At5g41890 isoform X1 [Hordeum vulgare subsp. vulgare]
MAVLPPRCCSSLFTAAILLLFCPSPASPHAFFIFGDSLVDAGNNDYLVTLSKANTPPYGVDFSFSGGKPTGRFTNGRTIADVIGEALGQESFAPPYLAPNSSAEVIDSGANYASGSSGIFDETGSFYIGRVPLGQQISYFEKTRAQILETMGENAAADFLGEALFTVAAGSNDILEYLSPSVPIFGRQKPDPADFQDALVAKLAFHLKRLNELGARKFVVADVGPLGCIPYVRALEFIPAGECSAAVNKLCEGYNRRLKRMIGRLNQETGPESAFVYTNTHGIVTEIIRQHRQYGRLSLSFFLVSCISWAEAWICGSVARRFRGGAGPLLRRQLPAVPVHRRRQLELHPVRGPLQVRVLGRLPPDRGRQLHRRRQGRRRRRRRCVARQRPRLVPASIRMNKEVDRLALRACVRACTASRNISSPRAALPARLL